MASTFKAQQEKLWSTVDKLKDEYRKYLKTLSKEQLEDEILELIADRYYAAFTTDLVMNVFLEEGLISESESNTLPTKFFRDQIAHLKELKAKNKSKTTKKKTVKKKSAKKKK